MKARTHSQERYKQIVEDCTTRAKLWQEHVANYQRVLAESTEAFSVFSAEFRERYLRAKPND